jgi:hypothetical protein
VRLERPSDDASFGQTEAGVDVTPDVTRLALGIVNAYLIGEAGDPWVLVDAGTPGNAEKIRAEAQSPSPASTSASCPPSTSPAWVVMLSLSGPSWVGTAS